MGVLHCTVDNPDQYHRGAHIAMYPDHCRGLLCPFIDTMMQKSERHLCQDHQNDDKSNELMSGVEALRLPFKYHELAPPPIRDFPMH